MQFGPAYDPSVGRETAILTLYHFNEATCGAKTRLTLAEKGVVYAERIMERAELTQPAYLKLNPNGVVPTLVHDDAVLIESSVIMNYVEDAFDGPALRPPSALERARMNWLMKQADDIYLSALGSVTYATLVRDRLSHQTLAEREAMLAALPDPAKRDRRRLLLDRGLEGPEPAAGMRHLMSMARTIASMLEGSSHICGENWSLADAAVTPFCFRLELFGLLEPMIRDKPQVVRWWSAIKARPSFTTVLVERHSNTYRASVERAVKPHTDHLIRLAS